MIELVAAAIAASFATGLIALTVGISGTYGSIDRAVTELHRPRLGLGDPGRPSLLGRLAGGGSPRRSADLAVLERDEGRWVQDRLKWAALVAALAALAAILLPVAGGGAPSAAIALAALVGGAVAGWFYAIVDRRTDAERARREVRHAVASYLELVTILMSGGAGPESAMFVAADVGQGPAFRQLRAALAAAQVRQEPPWAMLGPLGARLGATELTELGSSMTLAGGGAQVKDSLAVKAASIRVSDLARIEAEAQSRSETMALPVVMMFTGFLLLLGYPAMAGLTGP